MNSPLFDLAVRFLINTVMLIIITRFLYYTGSRKKEYVFTSNIIGVAVFFLCYLLSSINLELGLALGLFAIFGILRYRTTTVQIREMTYMFLAITVSVINSLTAAGYSALIILGVNTVILLITAILELLWFRRSKSILTVRYEKIELIRPENRTALIEDLEKRLGIEVLDVHIGAINFLRDTAMLEILYDAKRYPSFLSDFQEN
jgi:prepilin signal peptidase PulO-like enzyme (type II secretory pathway)